MNILFLALGCVWVLCVYSCLISFCKKPKLVAAIVDDEVILLEDLEDTVPFIRLPFFKEGEAKIVTVVTMTDLS